MRSGNPAHALAALVVAACAPPQATRAPRPPPPAADALAEPADPAIAALLAQVSAARLEAIDRALVGFGTRHTLSETASPTRGIGAARRWIAVQFQEIARACGGCLDVQEQRFTFGPAPRVPQPTELVNVVATLRGSDPVAARRVLVMSAHYDSRCSDALDATCDAPGANDDGSGVSALLEAARVLAQKRFPATIVFVAFPGEEQGLYGSQHFAEQAAHDGWDIEADLNNDIVGGNRTPGDTRQDDHLVRVFSEGVPAIATTGTPEALARLRLVRGTGGENDSPSRELARAIDAIGRAYLAPRFEAELVFRPDRYLRGGDQVSFLAHGIPAVRFTEYREDFHHQHQNVRNEGGIAYGDLPRFVDFAYLANVTRMNAAALATLASAPAPPAQVELATKQLENTSTLTWRPSPDGQVARYEIVWRGSDEPRWTHVVSAGTATTFTLDRAKDDVELGVRAVDALGHHSVAVAPVPAR